MNNKTLFTFPLEIKTAEETGVIAGYASVFDVIDSHNDRIDFGAFTEAIIKHESQQHIKLLWQHRVDEPIGVFKTIRQDACGLYIEAKLLLEVTRAKEALALVKAGVIRGLSIGFTPVDSRTDHSSGTRIITAIDLWEISLVTFPANHYAQITHAKDLGSAWAITELVGRLKTATAILS